MVASDGAQIGTGGDHSGAKGINIDGSHYGIDGDCIEMNGVGIDGSHDVVMMNVIFACADYLHSLFIFRYSPS